MTIIYLFSEILSARAVHATDSIPPRAPFRWRVTSYMVPENVLLASLPVRLRLVFLPLRRVFAHGRRGHGDGRLNPVSSFLSLLHVKVQQSPPILVEFHFIPFTFNCVYGPDLCYISFNFV